MQSGLDILHDIDQAIHQTRQAVNELAQLPARTAAQFADVERKRAAAYNLIARERLKLVESGGGGALGYADEQAEQLLETHHAKIDHINDQIDRQLTALKALEMDRRALEKAAHKAVDTYDKAAAKAEAQILKTADYQAQFNIVQKLEGQARRAFDKLSIAQKDEAEKGKAYLQDPFFSYLHNRAYGTHQAKGWFLTRWLDRWVAALCDYPKAFQNYQRLKAIPERLKAHAQSLENQIAQEKTKLEALEAQMLDAQGVTTLHNASLEQQSKLDQCDEKIAEHEKTYHTLLQTRTELLSGEIGPYRKALSLLAHTLEKQDLPDLERLALQTLSPHDDTAIEQIRTLSDLSEALKEDHRETQILMQKHQHRLAELEQLRRKFKQQRYDAPASSFKHGELIRLLLRQLLAGAITAFEVWQQIERAQRTHPRYSDHGFGGKDWTEGLRRPRNTGGARRVPQRRSSTSRKPRQSLPKIKSPRGGGFRTGGGF